MLQRVVIPQFRKNVANLRVVGAQPLPNLARQLGAGQQTAPGVRSAATAGKVRLEYQLAAWPMEEELYAVVETHTYPLQTLQGVCTNVSWVASYLFSFRAPKGQLAGNAEKFWVMARSFRPNPQWFNKYTQLVNMLVQRQIQQIRQIGEISRIISRTNDEISDMIMRSYKQRSAVYDRLADQFSQAIRGVDAYYDPTSQGRVELPGGYDRVWSNGLGDYVLTDDANFDPNVDSNQNWTPLRRQ